MSNYMLQSRRSMMCSLKKHFGAKSIGLSVVSKPGKVQKVFFTPRIYLFFLYFSALLEFSGVLELLF